MAISQAREDNSSHPGDTRFFGGAALVLAATLLLSAKAVLVKLIYGTAGGIEPITIMAGRVAFGLPCFLLAAVWAAGKSRGKRAPLTVREWAAVVALGLAGYYLASLLDTMGLAYISAGLERLILFVYPTLVVLIGAAVCRTLPAPATVAALALTYAGVWVAFRDQAAGGPGVAQGSMLVLGAAASFAVFTLGSATMIRRIGATRFTAYAMTVSGLATAAHYLLSGAPSPADLPGEAVLLCAVMALFATVLPAFMMSAGIRHIGAGRTALLGTVGPVGTFGLAALLLGEAVTPAQTAGAVLVIAGVALTGRAGSPRRGTQETGRICR